MDMGEMGIEVVLDLTFADEVYFLRMMDVYE